MTSRTVSYSKTFPPGDDVAFVFNTLKHTCTDGNRLFYIYGGVPRDQLRGVRPRDVDVFIKDVRNVHRFIDFLRQADRLRKETRVDTGDQSQYSMFSLEIQTNSSQSCLVDITSDVHLASGLDDAKRVDVKGTCDFTCNNLILTREGYIGTRTPPPKEFQLTPAEWTIKCVRDAVEGNLVWMVTGEDDWADTLGPKAYNEMLNTLDLRLEKMVAKNFKPPLQSATDLRCRKLVTFIPEAETVCAICKESYDGIDTCDSCAVQLKCKHHFHVDCVDFWVKSRRYHATCPVCRESISWMYEEKTTVSPRV